MSDYIVEISETSDYTISIDTNLVQNDNSIVLELSNPNTIDIISNFPPLSLNDLPEGYPLNSTTGNLPISRVSGLIGESGIYYSNGNIGISGIPYNLISVHNITAGTGIGVSSNSGIFNISVTGTFGLTSEEVDDRVNQLLVGGNGINLNYNDLTNSLTILATGLQPSGNYSVVGHNHNTSDITNFNSSVNSLIFSIGTIDLHNGGMQNAQLLQFNNNNYQSIITGPAPSGNNNSQRLIIQGQRASGTYAEGGDVYLWGGDANYNGGDIKIYAGDADNISPNNGYGGYVNIDGGRGVTAGGNVEITAGYSEDGQAGRVEIVGGSTSNGTAGDVVIKTNNHSQNWTFGSNGRLSLPNGNLIESQAGQGETNIQIIDNTSPFKIYTHASASAKAWIYSADGELSIPGEIIFSDNTIQTTAWTGSIPPSSVINFNSAVSGLLPSIVGTGYINSSFNNNIYTISVTGLQPSGIYASGIHYHSSSDITDFNNAVSGLIPPSNFTSLTGLSGIIVTNSGTNYFVSLNDPTIQLSDITDLSSNGRTFLLTPSSYNLLSLITDETGSGILVFNDSPVFSGVPTAPTAPSGTNSTQIANTSFVRTEISNLVNSAPNTLDTLNELAIALGNDPNFSTTITNSLAGKANLSGAIFTGLVTIPSGTGNFNSLAVNGTGVSINGHTHTGDDILIEYDDSNNAILSKGSDGSKFLQQLIVNGLTEAMNSVGGCKAESINDFNSSVSGLLPSVSGTGYVSSSFANNRYTISVTGLQPSGNYANAIHSHGNITNDGKIVGSVNEILVTTTSGEIVAIGALNPEKIHNDGTLFYTNFYWGDGDTLLDMLYYIDNAISARALTSHTHGNITNNGTIGSASGLLVITDTSGILSTTNGISSNYITNFNSSVSGLIPVESISGSEYVNVSSSSGNFTVSVTGLQPSGNYSVIGHTHTASNITDFNSSVSGLLPVKNIIGGTGISVSSLSGIYTIDSTGSGVLSDQSKALVTTVFNKTGSPIPKMTAVYINGGQGDLPTVSLAIATSDMTSAATYGLTYETINNMSSGKVIVFGALTGLNTDQFNPTAPQGNVNGSVLYLSPTVSGSLTLSKPSAPNHIVAIGTIVRTHQNEGVVEVRVQNGFELEELHNVAISGVSNGQFLQYNSGSGLWVPSSSGNFSILSVNNTGVSVIGHTHTSSNIVDFNSSVSGLLPVTNILGGSNITISQSGTNFTVAVTGSLGLTTEEVDDRVSNLLLAGSGIVLNYDDNANSLTISTSGLQPSGNYANTTHVHTASDITDFNSSVSGLLPTISNSGDDRILTSTGSNVGINAENNLTFNGSLLNVIGSGNFNNIFISGVVLGEIIDDEVAGLLIAGSGINLNYDDNANTLTINTNTNIINSSNLYLWASFR